MGTVDEPSCRGKTDILGDASRAWMRPCRGWEPQDGGPSNASCSGGKPHNQKGSQGGASLLAVFILICRMSGRQRRDAKMRSSKGRHNIEKVQIKEECRGDVIEIQYIQCIGKYLGRQ